MRSQSEHPLIRMADKLARHALVAGQGSAAILQMPYVVKTLKPGSYFVQEGTITDRCGLLSSGLAVCQKATGEGDRQIVSTKIPGDILGLQNLYLGISDYNIQALTQCEIVTVASKDLKADSDEHATILHAIAEIVSIEASMLREWLLNIGRRDALSRVAHFLCEFAVRTSGQEKFRDGPFELPMTQEQLGDALGLTAVHINRMLKILAKDGLIVRDGKNVRLPDWGRLRDVADFNARHLHLDQ